MPRILRLAAVPALAVLLAVPVRADKPAAKPASAPWFVDDDALLEKLTDRLGELAEQKKCLDPGKLRKLVAEDRTCKLTPARPSEARLDPEDVYERALPSVFIVGSVVKEDDEYVDGRMATAWVLAADGVLVSNWHVFDKAEDGEFFGAMDHKGNVYPLTGVLAVNKTADVAVFKIAAAGLTPLPVAERPARVGSWVGVLGHPGDRYYTFTQGHVSRYSTVKSEDGGAAERWMAVTAEYAYGSSGSPVLDRRGAVVGMAAMTENLDYPDDGPAPDDKPKDDPKKPDEKQPEPRKESALQMVVKLTTPAADIRKAIGAE